MNIPFAERLLTWRIHAAARRDPVLPLGDGWRLASAQRILLVVTTGLGDAILSSPVIPAVRRAAPQADIRLFVRSAWAPLFKHDPELNGVIAYPGKFRRFFATVAALRDFAPDTVLALHANDPDVLPLCYLSGARRIVRVPTAGTRFPDLLSNRAREADRSVVPGWHYIDNRLRVLDTLGAEPVSRVPRLFADPARVAGLRQRAAERTGCQRYLALHTYSADVYRSLPLDLVREVLAGLRAAYPEVGVVLTGSGEDGKRLTAALGEVPAGVWLSAGQLSLEETAACLAGAEALISPDTGILHLGAALDRPLLAVLSPTSDAPTRSQVVGPRTASAPVRIIDVPPTCTPCVTKNCPHRPVTCLAQLQAGQILDAFAGLLPR